MAEVRNELVKSRERAAVSSADFLKGGCAKQIGPDTIENDGGAKSPLFNGVALGHPSEGAAENFACSPDAFFSGRSGFDEVNGVATFGKANVIVEGGMCFHAATFARNFAALAPSPGQLCRPFMAGMVS